jgi:hypothetical protein
MRGHCQRAVPVFLALLVCAACETTYQASSAGIYGDGYGDTRVKENSWNVYFQGGPYAEQDFVEAALLYRCAEIAQRAGFDHFLLVSTNTTVKTTSHTVLPGQYSGTVSETATGYRTQGRYTPPMRSTRESFRAHAYIVAGHGPPPPNDPGAFVAAETLLLLGPRVGKAPVRSAGIGAPSRATPSSSPARNEGGGVPAPPSGPALDEPTAAVPRVAVFFAASGEDPVGRQLAAAIRESLRQAPGLSLVEREEDGFIGVHVTTLDPGRHNPALTPDTSTVYSVAWTITSPGERHAQLYLSSSVGVCGGVAVALCGKGIASQTDEKAAEMKDAIRRKLDPP